MSDGPDPVAYHDALAGGWSRRYQRGGFARRARFIKRQVIPLLPEGGRWLDAGCGSGIFSLMLAEKHRSVLGVDASSSMILQAQLLGARLSDAVCFELIESVERLSFADGSFDGAVCFSVLEYLARPEAALYELARVVRPGGMLVVSVPHPSSAVRVLERAFLRLSQLKGLGGLGYLSLSSFLPEPSKFAEMAENVGFRVERMIGFDPLLPRPLHVFLKPSLIFSVLRRIGSD